MKTASNRMCHRYLTIHQVGYSTEHVLLCRYDEEGLGPPGAGSEEEESDDDGLGQVRGAGWGGPGGELVEVGRECG